MHSKKDDKFLPSYDSMVKNIRNILFDQKNADSALSVAQVYGELLWHLW